MDSYYAHCVQVARRLEGIAQAVEAVARSLIGLDSVRWVSLSAQRFRGELERLAQETSAVAQLARQAAAAWQVHAQAVWQTLSQVSTSVVTMGLLP